MKLASFGKTAHTIRFMTDAGIDGLVGVNTQNDYESIDIDKKEQKLFQVYTTLYGGGVSGKPIRAFAYEEITKAKKEIIEQGSPLRIIHVGGISSYQDIEESRKLGDKVILREWYTGMMDKMAKERFEDVYNSVLEK